MNPHALIVSDVYFPRVNGVSTSIRSFREDLARQGMPSTLVAPAYGEQTPQGEVDILRVASRAVPFASSFVSQPPAATIFGSGCSAAW